MSNRKLFEVQLTENNVGGYDAFVPAFNLTTQGSSYQDAIEAAADLIHETAAFAIETGKPLPTSTFSPSSTTRSFGVMIDLNAIKPELETMSVTETAELLDVSDARVYAMIKSGILHAQKIGYSLRVSTASVKNRINSPKKTGRPRKDAAIL